jgi:AmmeMemoRadiSam system protein B/AmmeMemoRadiSam system protein A
MNDNVREPVVAGAFYPADKKELKAVLNKLFSEAEKKEIKGKIKGIIVPHAGYPYSGWTAAKVFKQIEDESFESVILLGPSHQVFFNGFSVYRSGSWKTPLGNVPIDESLADSLIAEDTIIDFFPQAHANEHSLEVEIPFLQTILDNFKIVPIVAGSQDPGACKILSDAIVKVCKDKNVLLLASSDLYHGHSYNECYNSDSMVLKTVGAFDADGFKKLLTQNQNIACGAGPIYVVLLSTRAMGANSCTLIEHTTSGDVTGQKEGYIVGYAGFVISKNNSGDIKQTTNKENEEILNKEEKKFLLDIARKSINAAVKGKSTIEFEPPTERLREPKGVFVTLNKKGNLRGCIGYIQAVKPLYKSVSEMAVSAALKDPRFPPVSPQEIPDLTIEISVLTPLQKLENLEDVKVGRDGLYIKKGISSGLLLPQVATEYGWDRETFLEQTCYKAGLPSNAYKDPDTQIYTFQALIFNEQE